jgi:hypothetical protein
VPSGIDLTDEESLAAALLFLLSSLLPLTMAVHRRKAANEGFKQKVQNGTAATPALQSSALLGKASRNLISFSGPGLPNC